MNDWPSAPRDWEPLYVEPSFHKRHVTLKRSDRPHVFNGSGNFDATGETCWDCGDVDSSPWHWVEGPNGLEPP